MQDVIQQAMMAKQEEMKQSESTTIQNTERKLFDKNEKNQQEF